MQEHKLTHTGAHKPPQDTKEKSSRLSLSLRSKPNGYLRKLNSAANQHRWNPHPPLGEFSKSSKNGGGCKIFECHPCQTFSKFHPLLHKTQSKVLLVP